MCLIYFCEPWPLFSCYCCHVVCKGLIILRKTLSISNNILHASISPIHWDWVTLASTPALSYSPECQKDPLASILLGWAGTALLKKMTPKRKGITSVRSFGRQKTFYLKMYHLHVFYHLFKKVAAKLQCVAFLGQMHYLGLVKSLRK